MPRKKIYFNSCFTREYAPWANIYTTTLNAIMMSGDHCELSAHNCSERELEGLPNFTANILLNNMFESDDSMAKKIGCSVDQLREWRVQIKNDHVTDESAKYKVYISVMKRYRSLSKVWENAKKKQTDFLLHSDIDVYFNSIEFVNKIPESASIACYKRDMDRTKAGLPLGAFIIIRTSSGGESFVRRWMEKIDEFEKRGLKRGDGQVILRDVIQQSEPNEIFDLCKLDKAKFSKTFDESAAIWLTSNNKLHRGDSGMVTAREIVRRRQQENGINQISE